jgi:hypothetical protein
MVTHSSHTDQLLYHTALALSGFYTYSVLLKTGITRCINGNWEVMRMNYEGVSSELQIQLRSMRVGDLKRTSEIAACVIQLTSFEVRYIALMVLHRSLKMLMDEAPLRRNRQLANPHVRRVLPNSTLM